MTVTSPNNYLMDNISAAIAGAGNNRNADDYYQTPEDCTLSFLDEELPHLRGLKVWEPACGAGKMSRVLIDAGLEVYSTDLVYRGFGQGVGNFLEYSDTDCQAVVTNPPFCLAEEFIRHALLTLEVDYLALLLKSQYWHTKKRLRLFEELPPAVVYPLTWRPDFSNSGKNGMMDCQWTVWRGSPFPTVYKPLKRIRRTAGEVR